MHFKWTKISSALVVGQCVIRPPFLKKIVTLPCKLTLAAEGLRWLFQLLIRGNTNHQPYLAVSEPHIPQPVQIPRYICRYSTYILTGREYIHYNQYRYLDIFVDRVHIYLLIDSTYTTTNTDIYIYF